MIVCECVYTCVCFCVLCVCKVPAAHYHASVGSNLRSGTHADWMAGRVEVLATTCTCTYVYVYVCVYVCVCMYMGVYV